MEKTYFIESKEQFFKIRAAWKNYINSGNRITASQIMLYNALRSHNILQGFSPKTNELCLANGHKKWAGTLSVIQEFSTAIYFLNSSKKIDDYMKKITKPFGELIKEEDFQRAWELIKLQSEKLRNEK